MPKQMRFCLDIFCLDISYLMHNQWKLSEIIECESRSSLRGRRLQKEEGKGESQASSREWRKRLLLHCFLHWRLLISTRHLVYPRSCLYFPFSACHAGKSKSASDIGVRAKNIASKRAGKKRGGWKRGLLLFFPALFSRAAIWTPGTGYSRLADPALCLIRKTLILYDYLFSNVFIDSIEFLLIVLQPIKDEC